MSIVLVHGGAGGWQRWPDALERAMRGVERAAAAGRDAMAADGSAVDAVEAAVRLMEDDPVFNAGRGAHPKSDGTVELDAMIMDGATLAAGAVAAVPRVRNAVSLARRVMADTPHVLLAGEGASRFADSIGFPRCTNDELLVARDRPLPAHDTVGAVALDHAGNVAAATSTGGVPAQMPGRVGDSPIPGAGGYADNASAAVSATGDGEAFIKLALSARVADMVAAGADPQRACEEAIGLLGSRLGASGGLIALDARGRMGIAFNSAAMPWAWASTDGGTESGSGTPAIQR